MRAWALVALLSLAFSQVALATAYCAMSAPQMAAAMADGADCHGMDPAAKHHCQKMCRDEPQKSDAATIASLPPAPDTGLRIRIEPAPRDMPRDIDQDVLLARSTSPPPTILFAHFLK